MDQTRMVNISLNHQGSDVLLEVDEDTANILLNDPAAAENYLQQLNELNDSTLEVVNLNEDIDNNKTDNTVIWTARKPTPMDGEATVLFLNLRSKYAKEFDDKKTLKAQIWSKIASEMQKEYNLGESPTEKCRQKFSNLQKQYFKHITHVKTTGEKFKEPPPYFQEMHDILGGKDKSNPQNLQDSLDDINKNINIEINETETESKEDNEAGPSQSSTLNIKNRFGKTNKSEKPQSNVDKIMEFLNQQQAEETKYRQKHFEIMENALKSQQAQGDRLLNVLENAFLNKNKKRKRRRSSDDSQ